LIDFVFLHGGRAAAAATACNKKAMNRAARLSRNEPSVTLVPVGARPDAVLVDVVVLTPETGLYEAARGAVGERNPVWRARSADEAADLLVTGRCGVLLIDLAAASSRAPELIEQVVAQFPDVVVCVAGTRADEPALASLISDGLVYRFMHKPTSARRAGMFLQAAIRRHAELRAGRAQMASLLPMLQRLHREAGWPRRYLVGLGTLTVAIAAALFVEFGGDAIAPEAAPAAAVPVVAATADRSDPFLARARAALQAGRLEAPEGRNALDLYHAVLLAEPDRDEARAGLESTIARLLGLAERHVAEGRSTEARRLMRRVLGVVPTHPEALSLVQRLDSPEPPVRVADERAAVPPPAAASPAPGPAIAPVTAAVPAPGSAQAPAATAATSPAATPAPTSVVADPSRPALPQEARPDPLTPRYVDASPPAAVPEPASTTRAYGAPIRELPTVAPTTVAAPAVAEPAPFSSGPALPVVADEFDRVYARDPVYPPEALRAGTSGWVELSFTITPSGAVRDVAVLDSEPYGVFDAAAAEAVAQWRFRPRAVNGESVPQRSTITLRFDVDG
jgi:periplasmic protein TonB